VARHHKHKEINRVIEDAVAAGWTPERGGHGLLLRCPCPEPSGGRVDVPSTPTNPENAARRIRRQVGWCPDRHELDGYPRPRNG
jgi:hypothetical protein